MYTQGLKHNQHPKLWNAYDKYGIENFKIELLESVDNDLIACEREAYYIQLFNTYHYGYNATLGGDGKAYIEIARRILGENIEVTIPGREKGFFAKLKRDALNKTSLFHSAYYQRSEVGETIP